MEKRKAIILSGILLPIIVLLSTFAAFSQKPILWGDLSPGSYGVGFRQTTFFDKHRKNVEKANRPIEVMIWYPTKKKSQKTKLTFKNYVSLLPNFRKESTQTKMQKWLSTSISGDSEGIDKDKLDKILNSKMFAGRNAKGINKRFPLVLWTMRHETFVAQSVLCEYLASHGYVVASARFGGKPLPFPWVMKTVEEKITVFKTHLTDLNFAFKNLIKEKNVDAKKVTIMNWSYAAELSPLMQMQNSNVGLVIGLSSNPLNSFGLYQGTKADSNLNPEKLNVPYIIMSERIGPNGNERTAPEILNKLSTESFFVRFPKLTHGNFNVLEGMIPGIFGIEKVQSWSKGGKTAKAGYEAISQYTLYFLDQYMKTENKFTKQNLKRKLSKEFVIVTRFGKTH